MGLLKTLFRPNPERHEQRGDACVRAADWGMAKLAYEAALDALEKTAPGESAAKARILEKLHGSMEALAREHIQTAEDLIESRYQKAKAYIDKLTQAILAKAFCGELVPQDLNDEPASELLKRIKEEKAKTETKAKSRK